MSTPQPSSTANALSPRDPGARRLPWRQGLLYGGLATPLAFVSLPLYVNLPHHYATTAGVALTALGTVLLATRLLDAVIDPALGRLADRLLRDGPLHAWRAAVGMAVVLGLGFGALWHPVTPTPNTTLIWLTVTLMLSTLAYSALAILHQAWGTRWNGTPSWRAQVSAWREGAGLMGVLLASALPYWAGWTVTTAVLSVALCLGMVGLHRLSRMQSKTLESDAAPLTPLQMEATAKVNPPAAPDAAKRGTLSPWRDTAFRHLLAVFLVNGTASAIPATLLPFFVSDRLQTPGALPWLLLCYFGAAVAGLPIWVSMVRRWGLAGSWRIGMVASVAGFSLTPWLGAGDVIGFGLICLASGWALGADLSLPGALLTGIVHHAGHGGQQEGRYLGWWTCAAKLNLALAAGVTLPLLDALGYQSGRADPPSLEILAWTYGGLPCLLKLLATMLLWRAERLNPLWRTIA
jgi:glycoside/pentoside/hexuronide:cation symporter, GPH family